MSVNEMPVDRGAFFFFERTDRDLPYYREPPDGYLVFQGGVPEIQEFLGRIWS